MKKYSLLILAGFLGVASLTGAAETKTTAVETKIEEKAPAAEAETVKAKAQEELAEAEAIGEESEEALTLKLANMTGMDILKMELSTDGETFGENLLGEDVVFADKEVRDWFVEKPQQEDVKFDLRLTFKEEETKTLHDLPFGKTEEVTLERTEKYAYLTYKDEKGEEVSTKKAEKKLAKKGEEATEAAQTAEAVQETAAIENTDQAAPVYDYSTEPVYDTYYEDNSYTDYGTGDDYDTNYGEGDSGSSDSDDDPNDWTYTYDDGGDSGDNCLDDGITLN